ncbi:hypothetical protein [Thermococcus sp.]
MTELKDIEVLIKAGAYGDAIRKVHELEDPFDKVQALTMIAHALYYENEDINWIETLLEDAMYLADKIKKPQVKVSAYGLIASTYSSIGDNEAALILFEDSIDIASRIKNPIWRSLALAYLAYYLAISGFAEHSLDIFEIAFDEIIRAEVGYNLKVDYLIEMAELLEKAGDQLPSKEAIPFYTRSYDIFDKLNLSQKAALLEKKSKLAFTVLHAGMPEIREALNNGDGNKAVSILSTVYSGIQKFIALLEVALWLRKINNPQYLEITKTAFKEDIEEDIPETTIQYIARLLTELGDLEKAIIFANKIGDIKKRSEALSTVAVALAKQRKFEKAYLLAREIPEDSIKRTTIEEIAAIERS